MADPKTARPLFLHSAAQVVTLAGPNRPRVGRELEELGIIENGAILIENGIIVAVGPTNALESALPRDVVRWDARGMVVLPGFVDAHTHLVFAGDRVEEFQWRMRGLSYEEIARRGGGIWTTVRQTRAASEDALLEIARHRLRWFLEHGTTTIEVKSGYGLSREEELKILRVIRRLREEGPLDIVPTLLAAHVVPEEFVGDRSAYIRMIVEELLPEVAREGLAEYHDVFCDAGAFTVDEARILMEAARAHGLKLRLHAEQLARSGAARLAAEFRARTADHLEKITDEDIAALAEAGVMAVLLPGACFHLGRHEYPPARKLIEAGVPVVLATDFNPGTSPTPSMPMILALACTQMKLTPAEAIAAATINAAYSLDRGHQVGSLEIGKRADLVLFEASDYRQIPYFFGVNLVRAVFIQGRVVYERKVEVR
ncbi:MAG: imidazolonepropionase [Blastocatellia bacterium]|nr:imidazolonepropionase [Blastocatellia bacterium]MCS7156425.1 imidazolonepropionase [Blastocatellia bacterium]MCX7751834.1 imidazolonepropionase [Blastocatellia bacterium]MDW8168936.1 imidazolonepropionase [Acidobacteriota bacterium]MDW8256696.1 imidazolonepropionase [Acidobacteriota bacterium]